MPMDEYDMNTNNDYKKILNIYKKDYNNIDEKIKFFFKEFEQSNYILNLSIDMKKLINNLVNGLNILENRHIVCISGRIINSSNVKLETYLINAWR